jgi:hypothetical protein
MIPINPTICRFDNRTQRCRLRKKRNGIPCNPYPTTVVEIVSPVTGRVWMDRNLGAWQAAKDPRDTLSYGDLFQFGRRNDGHQCRLSQTSPTRSTTFLVPSPDTSKFITSNRWSFSDPSAFWNESSTGINDVIYPPGFRLPTQQEWEAEIAGWGTDKIQEAFENLKLPLAGFRLSNGSVVNEGIRGVYHSSSANSSLLRSLEFSASFTGAAISQTSSFSSGRSIRCIKD